jgi:hypothetical protein
MMGEANVLEMHIMKDPENTIVPAEAMHDVDEKNIEATRPYAKETERGKGKQSGKSL